MRQTKIKTHLMTTNLAAACSVAFLLLAFVAIVHSMYAVFQLNEVRYPVIAIALLSLYIGIYASVMHGKLVILARFLKDLDAMIRDAEYLLSKTTPEITYWKRLDKLSSMLDRDTTGLVAYLFTTYPKNHKHYYRKKDSLNFNLKLLKWCEGKDKELMDMPYSFLAKADTSIFNSKKILD